MDRRFALSAICALALLHTACATTGGSSDRAEREGPALAEEAGAGVASALATVVYAPAKISYAAVGTVVGGGAYLASGANPDVANAVIGPAIGGDYIVTPSHLEDPDTLEFVGKGYGIPKEQDGLAHEELPEVAAAGPPAHCAGLGAMPSVYFQTGGTALSPEAVTTLDGAVHTLRDCPWATAEIRAFSDAMGSRESNLKLSRERAAVVRAYLVTSGVDSDRLRLLAFGEESPASTNETRSGRAANRRVEVTIR